MITYYVITYYVRESSWLCKHLSCSYLTPSLPVDKKKEIVTDISRQPGHKKKIEKEEERLKSEKRDLSYVKMQSMFVIGFIFTSLMGMFNSM